jgi:drug/metabolite transporter (DMT)-like permease
MRRTGSLANRSHIAAFFLALFSAALFGAATPAAKLLLSSMQPLQLAGLLGFGALLVALPLTLYTDERLTAPWRLSHPDRMRLYASLVFGATLGPVLHLAGLTLSSASSVSMLLNLELVFTAALATLFFGERLSWRGWVAFAGALAAAALISYRQEAPTTEATRTLVWSGLLVAGACLCWALDNNCTATIRGISAAQIVFWKGLACGVVNTSLAFAMQPLSISAAGIGLGILLGVLSWGVSIILYIVASHGLGALRTQTVFSSYPFWGLGLSVIFLQEELTALQIGAAVTLIAALVLLSFDTRRAPDSQPMVAQ